MQRARSVDLVHRSSHCVRKGPGSGVNRQGPASTPWQGPGSTPRQGSGSTPRQGPGPGRVPAQLTASLTAHSLAHGSRPSSRPCSRLTAQVTASLMAHGSWPFPSCALGERPGRTLHELVQGPSARRAVQPRLWNARPAQPCLRASPPRPSAAHVPFVSARMRCSGGRVGATAYGGAAQPRRERVGGRVGRNTPVRHSEQHHRAASEEGESASRERGRRRKEEEEEEEEEEEKLVSLSLSLSPSLPPSLRPLQRRRWWRRRWRAQRLFGAALQPRSREQRQEQPRRVSADVRSAHTRGWSLGPRSSSARGTCWTSGARSTRWTGRTRTRREVGERSGRCVSTSRAQWRGPRRRTRGRTSARRPSPSTATS